MIGETMFIYLTISPKAISVIDLRDVCTNQNSIYFISKTLTGSKTRYQKSEKINIAIVIASNKLHHYL